MESENIKTLNPDQQIRFLPKEIIDEIVSRFSVKSLLKFRCVSKSWHSLIGTKKFVKTHIRNLTNNVSFNDHTIISKFLPPNRNLKICSIRSLLYEPVTDVFPFTSPTNNPENSIHIVGCCDGLICILVDEKHFVLWNPSTREFKNLPNFDDQIWRGFLITKYGFGYDESCDDYKIFGLLTFVWPHVGCNEGIGKIYSLRTNSWKTIEGFEDDSPFDQSGVFVSGKFHWGKNFGVFSRWHIVSFDIESEACGIVEPPDCMEHGFYPKLGVLKGCLCLLCDYKKIALDIWVLKKYGVKESWNRVVKIPYLCDPWDGPFSTPLCIDTNGEVLFSDGSTFVVYDPKDNRFWHPEILDFDGFRGADVYVGSLVSLASDGEDEREN